MLIVTTGPTGRTGPRGPTGPAGRISGSKNLEFLLMHYRNTVILLGDVEIDKEELFNFTLTCNVLPYLNTNQIEALFNDPEYQHLEIIS